MLFNGDLHLLQCTFTLVKKKASYRFLSRPFNNISVCHMFASLDLHSTRGNYWIEKYLASQQQGSGLDNDKYRKIYSTMQSQPDTPQTWQIWADLGCHSAQ